MSEFDSRPTSRATHVTNVPMLLLKLFHGLLFGAGTGLTLSTAYYWFAPPRGHDYGPIIYTVLSIVLGGIFGGGLALLFRRSRRISVAIAIFAYLYLAWALVHLVDFSAKNQQFREDQAKREQHARAFATPWLEFYAEAYPASEESLPAMFGPLVYPGSSLHSWESPTPASWTIEVTTEDAIEDVLAYYMAVLPEGLKFNPDRRGEWPWYLSGQGIKSGDSRETDVVVQDGGGSVLIRFETRYAKTVAWPVAEGRPVPVAWPEDVEAHRARVAEKQAAMNSTIALTLTPIVLPGARNVSREYFKPGMAPVPNGLYVSDASWDDIRQQLTAQFGAPVDERDDKKELHFSGEVSSEDGIDYRVSVVARSEERYGAFGGVLLEYVMESRRRR